MITLSKPRQHSENSSTWHTAFLQMLPAISRHARIAFRDLNADAKEEAVQEVIANALAAYHRLVELGKTDVAYPSALARYGVAQCRDGRKVGGKLNVKDVSSQHCQKAKGVKVERLDRYDQQEASWLEVLVEDRKAGPAQTAASRIDFGAWLASLSAKRRLIAETLAAGESTGKVAREFGVTAGRISQLRRELLESWETFQGKVAANPAVT